MNRLPFIPTRDMVIFPGVVTPLYVGRTISIATLEHAMSNKSKMILAMQKEANEEDINIEKDIVEIGVLANILQVVKMPNNNIKILIEADSKVKIDKIVEENGHYIADYQIIKSEKNSSKDFLALYRKVQKFFEAYVNGNSRISKEIIPTIIGMKDPEAALNIMCTNTIIDVVEKYNLLATLDIEKRALTLLDILAREIELVAIEKKLDDKVKEKMNAAQKNYFLKEKINAIKEELGEGADDDLKELEAAIKKAKLPKDALKKVESELKKLSKMPSFSAEASVCRNYIETVIALPWNKESKDSLDIEKAEEVLEKDHYGLSDVKERILDYLAVKQLNPNMKGGILCLAGPPGVGKTSLVKSIAEAMDRKFIRVSLGGVRDEAEIRGHRRTYIGSMTGRIIKAMKEVGTKNPVILLDEIDKMASDFKGDPASALLEVLDPEQNFHFEDHYLDMPFDLSKVFFVATANDLRGVSGPLRDRMEIINISSYTEFEKMHIAKKYLLPQAQKENGMENIEFSISDETILRVINEYTREAGVRNLKREFLVMFRKLARLVIKEKKTKLDITVDNIETYLGKPKLRPDKMREKVVKIGNVNGLAWTSVGGTTLDVQAVAIPGKGGMSLTGTLGNVMKESASVAYTYIKAHKNDLGIENSDFFDKKDIHLHFPEGATPKDGPSAGIAITTAILSVISGRGVRQDVAMTGEITITGEVLAIGGVKEKVIGGHRVGIREIILPIDNKVDIDEIPEEVMKDMTIHFAETYADVEKIILEPRVVEVKSEVKAEVKAEVAQEKPKKSKKAKKDEEIVEEKATKKKVTKVK